MLVRYRGIKKYTKTIEKKWKMIYSIEIAI